MGGNFHFDTNTYLVGRENRDKDLPPRLAVPVLFLLAKPRCDLPSRELDGMGFDEMGWDRMGLDGLGWDGIG